VIRIALILLALIIHAHVHGTPRSGSLEQHSSDPTKVLLFEQVPYDPEMDELWNKACTKADLLIYDRAAASRLLADPIERIALPIPNGKATLFLDLSLVELTTNDFNVRTASGAKKSSPPRAAHYRGIVRGDSSSAVAVSVFENEVMAIISDGDGDKVIGRIRKDLSGMHIMYREDDLRVRLGSVCHTLDPEMDESDRDPTTTGDRTARCVRIHWEVNHDLYAEIGSTDEVTTYLTGLFNQMATLFDNDGIDVVLSEVFIWDVPDPFTGSTASLRLQQFREFRTTFNGDQALLLGFGDLGGVAWWNTLCGTIIPAMAYASVHTAYDNIPLYSWTVEVVTHETGHVLGSKHTHACAWNGNNTAIDGCGPAVGQIEGTCAFGPIPDPSIGGTIMSYCHLLETGIRFANGFGPQPSALIRNRVNSAACLASCGSDCYSTYGSQSTNESAYVTRLKWRSVGAVTYTLHWKPALDPTWNMVPELADTTYLLTGLTPGTGYTFFLISNCSAFSSGSSDTTNFTTTQPCFDQYEPNNELSEAATIAYGLTHYARIESPMDVDHYRVSWVEPGAVTITTNLDAALYQVLLQDSTGSTIAISTNENGIAKIVSVPVVAGNFILRVASLIGEYDQAYCYSLSYSLSVSCAAPGSPTVSSVTTSTAQVGLSAAPVYTNLIVEYKRLEHLSWYSSSNAQPPTANLIWLTPNANYEIRIKGRCISVYSGFSPYSDTIYFSTLPDPCPVSVLVAPKAYLDGPYDPGTGLMHDSLRRAGLVPLEEPYLTMGYNIEGPRTTTPEVLAITGSNAIVDWVIVEMRTNSYSGFETRSGLLQRDGDVVAPDGISPIQFCAAVNDYYFMAIGHRNHLGCVSVGHTFNSTTIITPLLIDLTTAPLTSGTNARRIRNGRYTLWAGDANKNRVVRYLGNANDQDALLQRIGGPYLTSTSTGYFTEDVNMDGVLKYVGINNDRDPILQTVGGNTPFWTRSSLGP